MQKPFAVRKETDQQDQWRKNDIADPKQNRVNHRQHRIDRTTVGAAHPNTGNLYAGCCLLGTTKGQTDIGQGDDREQQPSRVPTRGRS